MLFWIPWLLQILPAPIVVAPPQSDELILSGHWSPTLRPDARGYLSTSSGPVLELGHAKFSVESQRMELGGLLSGTDSVDPDAVLATGYGRVPTSGASTRTELKAEYGLGDATSLRITVPFETRTYRFLDDTGVPSRETVQGLGDILLGAGVEMSHQDWQRTEFELLVSVPTGSTRAREGSSGSPATPLLPYSMQLGGGTYALEPGLTWTHWWSQWSVGTSTHASLPLDRNDQGWNRGDRLEVEAWVSRRIDPFRSLTLGMEYQKQSSVEGMDSGMDPTYDPTLDPGLTGYQRVYMDLGLHLIAESNNRLAIEFGVPIWQDTEGPQLEGDLRITVGWWLTF
ncbi:MAG: hypothetical protein KDB61_08515 [Planctomycetes bacterium]|nr:hypothetical protein [Planctomycetota bacterium]